jgi:predicted  nucleic acid-binding Zn-ribbon protein
MSETGTVRAGEVEISREELLGQIAVLDGESPATETASTTTSDNAAEEPEQQTEKVKDSPKEDTKEPEKDAKESPEEKPKSKYSRAKKSQERANKSWKEANAEKDRVKAEKADLEKQKAEFEAQKTDAFSKIQQQTDAAQFTPEDYEQIAQEYRDEGEKDLAEAATAKAQTARETIEQQKVLTAQRTVMEQWEANLTQSVKDNPDLKSQDSELYKYVSELLDRKKILATYPEGINDAVEAAKAFIKANRVDELETENSKLHKEIKELNEKTQLNGSTVDQSGRVESFDSLAQDKQRNELLRMVKDADQRGLVLTN